jgi:hypothetical protein
VVAVGHLDCEYFLLFSAFWGELLLFKFFEFSIPKQFHNKKFDALVGRMNTLQILQVMRETFKIRYLFS